MVFALHTTDVHATVDGRALSATKQFALTCARMEVLAPLQMYAPVQPDGEELLVLFLFALLPIVSHVQVLLCALAVGLDGLMELRHDAKLLCSV